MITPAQMRAARALVDWSRPQAAAAAGISPETIKNIETGRFQPAADSERKIRLTFAHHGVGFFDTLGACKVWGVFLRHPGVPENDNDPAAADRQSTEVLALAGRMADAIAATIAKCGRCRPRDLEAKGFSREEIGQAWAMASALAAVQGAER